MFSGTSLRFALCSQACDSPFLGEPIESDVATAEDVPFALRIIVQCLLPGSPADLADEANSLSAVIHEKFPAGVSALHEQCPACQSEVPMADIIKATCASGHTWSAYDHFSPVPSVHACRRFTGARC